MENKMSTTRNTRLHSVLLKALYLIVLSAFPICAAHGQAAVVQPDKVTNAIANVQSGHFNMTDVDNIAYVGAVEGIPVLEKQFVHAVDESLKAKIADALVRLGDKDDTYWDYLVQQATIAVENDAPFPVSLEGQGKTGPQQYSPDFIAWTKAHNVSADSAAENETLLQPGIIIMLGQTEDPRAIPLLRQGLRSSNPFIENAAAMGLAQLQDKDSIPFIIGACQRASAATAHLVAKSLLYFDDPQAQNTAETYFSKEDLARELEYIRAHGNKPFSQHP